MYLSNKYTKWYNNIILKSSNRIIVGYSENHHIIPKSCGGKDIKSNIANLTAKEHFICHWLLTKMLTGKNKTKMIFAFKMMFVINKDQERYRPPAYLHEIAVANSAKEFCGYKHSEETKARMRAAIRPPVSDATRLATSLRLKGVPKSKKHRNNMSIAGKNRIRTQEHCDNISKGKKGKKRSQSSIDKGAESNRGQTRSEETKAKMRAAHLTRQPISQEKLQNRKLRKLIYTEEKRNDIITAQRLGFQTKKETADHLGISIGLLTDRLRLYKIDWKFDRVLQQHSNETRAKMKAAWLKRGPVSEETKAKMRAAALSRRIRRETKNGDC